MRLAPHSHHASARNRQILVTEERLEIITFQTCESLLHYFCKIGKLIRLNIGKLIFRIHEDLQPFYYQQHPHRQHRSQPYYPSL